MTLAVVFFVTSRRAPSAPESKPKAAPGCTVELFFPSPTPTLTLTPTQTKTLTPTQTKTPTPTQTKTPTPTKTLTPTQTKTLTPTQTKTPTPTQTKTPTPTKTLTPTQTKTLTPTQTKTPTPTQTKTPTPTITLTATPVPVGCGEVCIKSNPASCTGTLQCAALTGATTGICALPTLVNNCINRGSQAPYLACCTLPTSTPTITPTVTPTPTPTKTPTPTVTITLTPSPTPVLLCGDLTSNNENPTLGSTILLTCTKNASYVGTVSYEFMLIHKDSPSSPDPVPTPTPFATSSTGLATYTFPEGQYGFYRFMCRVCAGAYCTPWQNP